MTFVRACLLVVLAGCARGGADTGAIDAAVHHDAHPSVVTDASGAKDAPATPIDASVMIDAALGPDASTDGTLCTANAMCTDTGECCLMVGGVGICSPGTIIGSTCLPI